MPFVRGFALCPDNTSTQRFYYLSGAWRPTHAWGEFTPTLADVICMNHFPYFDQTKAKGIKVKSKDQVKLKYLVTAMIALRFSKKSTYATWLDSLIRENVAALNYWSRHSQHWLSQYALPNGLKDGVKLVCLPSSDLDGTGCEIRLGSLVIGIPLPKAG